VGVCCVWGRSFRLMGAGCFHEGACEGIVGIGGTVEGGAHEANSARSAGVHPSPLREEEVARRV
jgi:hypothetical protein